MVGTLDLLEHKVAQAVLVVAFERRDSDILNPGTQGQTPTDTASTQRSERRTKSDHWST